MTAAAAPLSRDWPHGAENEPDMEPRCDCGHLFEICDYPRCPRAPESVSVSDGLEPQP